MKHLTCFFLLMLIVITVPSYAQKANNRDSIIYKITYRDTVIYRYDTVRIKTYIYSDTLSAARPEETPKRKKGLLPNNWGIGPSVGAYYSPFNGFDVNIGFGIQYYLLAIPGFRNPHTGHRRNRK